MSSSEITWHPGALSRRERWHALETTGATVWLTGLSGSGKSTVAVAVEQALLSAGRAAYLLDGDNLRHGLNGDLGFSPQDRDENVRRVAEVARLFADAGTIALVSLVSPYRAARDNARRLHDEADLAFYEVWMAATMEECRARDPKGLYRRGDVGGLSAPMTGTEAPASGAASPYEEPLEPDLVLRADDDVARATRQVLALLSATQG